MGRCLHQALSRVYVHALTMTTKERVGRALNYQHVHCKPWVVHE